MSDFNAKMHRIQFRLGLCPNPAAGAKSAPRDPLDGFKGPTSNGREGRGGWDGRKKGGEWKGRRREGNGRRKGVEWKEEGKGKVGERMGNLPPLKFRSGYATAWAKVQQNRRATTQIYHPAKFHRPASTHAGDIRYKKIRGQRNKQ